MENGFVERKQEKQVTLVQGWAVGKSPGTQEEIDDFELYFEGRSCETKSYTGFEDRGKIEIKTVSDLYSRMDDDVIY